jgi:hypothetical protein
MSKKVIKVAAREKRRMVNAAVGKNFFKTVTEPLTNSDSILKKQAGVAHAAGLVGELLKLKRDQRIDTSELKTRIAKQQKRQITLELTTSGPNNRLCRVVDAGLGMTAAELETKFGSYAEAKARGERTRSLFGRGALDVLLYHDHSVIYSVASGILSRCKIYWDPDAMIDTEELGPVSKSMLDKYKLPRAIGSSGTVVEFRLKEGTPVPTEDQIIAKISSFYMLRLIAADPNTEVIVKRIRSGGEHIDPLSYDFPIGTVMARVTDVLDLGKDGALPVDILVARSDEPLQSDPVHIDRRENGLLFVDDNDAVMDLTLLPEYDRNPYLHHIYGIVRVDKIRPVLERKLEAEDAAAVLKETRDGFDPKHEITQKLFKVIEKHVKPIYEREIKRQRKGAGNRSDKLSERVNEALKAINQFNNEETDAEGSGEETDRDDAIFFSVKTIRLYAGIPKSVAAFINLEKVKQGQVVLFESNNPEIQVEPDSEVVRGRKGKKYQRIRLSLLCGQKGEKAEIIALTDDNAGKAVQAKLAITGVDDPPIIRPPDDIEFASSHYNGSPSRPNKAVLIVNLKSFTGKPEIKFWLEDTVGKVSVGEDEDQSVIHIKVKDEHLTGDPQIARVPITFKGTGWGQHSTLWASAKLSSGELARAKCKLRLQRPPGDNKFSDLHYEDLGRNVLGDVAGDKLYVNAGYGLHRQLFGLTEDEFNQQIEINPIAQLRAASVLVETIVHHTASVSYREGGTKGIQIDPDDPVGSFRSYFEDRRIKLEPAVMRALAPDIELSNDHATRN